MTWWYYLIIYYVICIIILTCCALYDIKKNAKKGSWGAKEWIRLFVLGPLMFPIGIFLYSVYGIIEYAKKLWKKIKNKREFIAKYGFSPDEHYECFSMMGGVGIIVCEECGYKEKIVSFIHGFCHSDTGRQCPNCYAFTSEHNVSDNDYSFGKSESDFLCPRCGTIIRKKEESIFKGDDVPLYCPKCHSHKLHYHCEYMT